MRAFLHPNQAANLVSYPAIKGLNILHKLHSNFYIHCCFHFQRRFLYEFGLIATILLGSVCCQLWVAEPPFANNAEDISLHITLCTASSTSTTFVAFGFYNHPINWHSCTWLHLAVYNFFCIISGIFCAPFLHTPLWGCYGWHCTPCNSFHSRVSSPHENTIRW